MTLKGASTIFPPVASNLLQALKSCLVEIWLVSIHVPSLNVWQTCILGESPGNFG